MQADSFSFLALMNISVCRKILSVDFIRKKFYISQQQLLCYLASPSETVFVQTRSFPEIFVMKIKGIINKALFMICLAVTVTRPAYFQNQIPRYRIPLILNSIELLHSFRRVLGKSNVPQ